MADISSGQGSRIGEALQDGPLVGAARNAESAVRRAKERVVEAKERLADKSIGELVDDGRTFVRENPGKTILVSIGIGALIGYLVGRRRS
jgi:ElaB/YqjD/DUF883 family membrane-anchored ribosome-binding protein